MLNLLVNAEDWYNMYRVIFEDEDLWISLPEIEKDKWREFSILVQTKICDELAKLDKEK